MKHTELKKEELKKEELKKEELKKEKAMLRFVIKGLNKQGIVLL
jgi:hypothetical protein